MVALAIKGFEYGEGFAGVTMRGSEQRRMSASPLQMLGRNPEL